ncbi:MAG: hypothetical protein DWQ05_20875 [Calditrichaeota bacterium]|nr:MAG: hypothetical protein DWQ05_20875 [Calditrichota bacterium]
MKVYWFFIFLLTLSFLSQSSAQNATARFLFWQPSARSIALGGAGVAIVDNSFASYYNPALLGVQSTHYQATGSFGRPYPFMPNTVYSFTGVTIPIPNIGVLALSTNRYWIEGQAITSEHSPIPTGISREKNDFINPSHWDAKLSFGTKLNENMVVGASTTFQKIMLFDYLNNTSQKGDGKSNTMLFSAGFLYHNLFPQITVTGSTPASFQNHDLKNGLSIGLAMHNLGPKIQFIDKRQNDNPPTYLTLGFGYTPYISKNASLTLLTDFEKQFFNDATLDYIHLGQELLIMDMITIRAGYFLDTFEPHTSYKTIGAGLQTKYFSINLARYNRGLQPAWHFDASLSMEVK